MADQTGDVTDSTGTTARPAADPGIDREDMQQSSAVEADSEVTDPDGNEQREGDGSDGAVPEETGVAPFGVGRFGVGGVTLDR